jgi:arabinofuranan 3-O-arabinosyltransferase
VRPQRVNGWAQGWVLPPGDAGEVVLRFTPNGAYQAALLSGLLGLLVVGVAAAFPSRRGVHAPVGTSRGATWLVVGLSPLAGGILTGWPGFLAMGLAVTLGGAARSRPWAPVAAGGSVALAGAAHAAARAGDFQLHSRPAQLLALLGLVVAAATFGAKGPEFFRRRNRRSRR